MKDTVDDATNYSYRLHLDDLPPGVLHNIFAYLGPRDLCCVSVTCRLWAALNRDGAANQVFILAEEAVVVVSTMSFAMHVASYGHVPQGYTLTKLAVA